MPNYPSGGQKRSSVGGVDLPITVILGISLTGLAAAFWNKAKLLTQQQNCILVCRRKCSWLFVASQFLQYFNLLFQLINIRFILFYWLAKFCSLFKTQLANLLKYFILFLFHLSYWIVNHIFLIHKESHKRRFQLKSDLHDSCWGHGKKNNISNGMKRDINNSTFSRRCIAEHHSSRAG